MFCRHGYRGCSARLSRQKALGALWGKYLFLLYLVAACATPAPVALDSSATTKDVESGADVAASLGPKPTTALLSHQHVAYTDGLHNENTDLIQWNKAVWLVFRGGETSQIGSADARLKVFRSDDLGDSWTMTAEIFMPSRDIRDPKFMVQDGVLAIQAISRVPGGHMRDAGGFAQTVRSETADGIHWSPPTQVADETWGLWRYVEHDGQWYATGYNDGDTQVGLFQSADGKQWKRIALIMDSSANVPSEAELRFFGQTAVALVREDNGLTLIDEGHTAVCVAQSPWVSWSCGRQFDKRLDGPYWFTWNNRQFIAARKHLVGGRKRAALYEITGDLTNPAATVALTELSEFQSAGDTSYVGILPLGGAQFLASWYSSDVALDPVWTLGMFSPSDIWLGCIDLSYLPKT